MSRFADLITRDLITRVLASCLLVVGLAVASATPSYADDDDDDTFEQKLLKNFMMGLGLSDGTGDIEYRERSPLVVPGKLDLPPPDEVAAAQRSALWPKDTDEQMRTAKKRTVREQRNKDPRLDAHPLLPNELNGNVPRITGSASRNPAQSNQEMIRPLRPDELGSKGNVFTNWFGSGKQESEVFVKEPERSSLTQPPPGYRTPSPDQPYAPGKQEAGGSSVLKKLWPF